MSETDGAQGDTTARGIDMQSRFRGFLPVVIDLETGGLNAATDAILEIAAVVLVMDENGIMRPEAARFHNVAPFEGSRLDPVSLEITGIDPADPAREAKPEREAFADVFAMIRKAVKAQACKRAILVAHNAHFDHAFINAASARHNLKRNPFHPFSHFDTASFAGLACGQTVLARACEVSGIDFDENSAHSAHYDAEKTAELFCHIVNRWKQLGGWPVDALHCPANPAIS